MENLPSLREKALSHKDETPKEVVQYVRALSMAIEQLKQQNVRSLTEDELFTIRDEHGRIKAVKKYVYLSYENKGLTLPIKSGPYVISASGYTRLNSEAGVSVISPKTVFVGGEEKPNPYVERDKNGRPVTIYSRKVAFGFSPMGQPKTADRTIIYDAGSYRMVDLFSKAAFNKDAFELLPKGAEAPKDRGPWAKYAIDESVDLWVNLNHPETLKWYRDIVVRERKIVDVAQTFAERNASKSWHGLDAVPGQVIPGQNNVRQINEWWVPVVCWFAESGMIHWDGRKYEQLQSRIEQITDGKAPAGDPGVPHQIAVDAGVDRIDGSGVQEPDEYQDEPIEIGGGVEDIDIPLPDPEDIPPPEDDDVQPEPAGEKSGSDVHIVKSNEHIVKQALSLRVAMPEKFQDAMTAYGFAPETMTREQAETILKELGATGG